MSEIIIAETSKEILKVTLATKKIATITRDDGQIESIIQEKSIDVDFSSLSDATQNELMEKF